MNVDFTATLEKLKKGDQVNILAEITDIKTIKDGKVIDRKPVFTGVRLTQIYSYNKQDSEDRVAKINTVMESSEETDQEVGLESGLDPFE
jgi:aspartate carbamoyltransferase regulatory subunit